MSTASRKRTVQPRPHERDEGEGERTATWSEEGESSKTCDDVNEDVNEEEVETPVRAPDERIEQ